MILFKYFITVWDRPCPGAVPLECLSEVTTADNKQVPTTNPAGLRFPMLLIIKVCHEVCTSMVDSSDAVLF